MAEWYSIVYGYHSLIDSSADGHWGYFCVLTIVNSASMNIGMHVYFQIIVLSRSMPGNGIAGSHNNFIFSFQRNLHTVFHSSCTNFTFPPTVWMAFLFSTLSLTFAICRLLTMATLTDVRRYLIVVLTCISLIMSNVEHFFMCLLAICVSSLKKYLLWSFAHFFIELFVSVVEFLYIVEMMPLSVALFTNIFSQSVGYLFILFMVFFAMQNIVSLIRSHLFTFVFASIALGDWSKIYVRERFADDLLQEFYGLMSPLPHTLCGVWDFSSLTRTGTCAPCIGSVES